MGAPRAHRIIWSEDAADAAEEALKQIEEGELLNGRLSHNLVSQQKEVEEGVEYAGDPSVSGTGGERPNFEFVRVPPPALPPKSVPE